MASKVKNSSKSDVVKSSTESATNKSISKNGMSSKTVDYLQNTLGRDYAVNYNGTGGIKLDYHTITNSDGSKTKLSTTLSDYIGKSETSKYSSAEEMLSANGINVNEIDIYK